MDSFIIIGLLFLLAIFALAGSTLRQGGSYQPKAAQSDDDAPYPKPLAHED